MKQAAAALLAALFIPPAFAQTVTDGDTIKLGGVVYRLWGIDAPESRQVCPDGWPAGQHAAAHLQALLSGKAVTCERRDTDRYGRVVALCRADGQDLGAAMVRAGHAWAFLRYSQDYAPEEKQAKADGAGLHGHDCATAWDWRAAIRSQSRQ